MTYDEQKRPGRPPRQQKAIKCLALPASQNNLSRYNGGSIDVLYASHARVGTGMSESS